MMGWGPATINIALARRSVYLQNKNRVSGLLLANHTSIHKLFQKQAGQFDRLRSRSAFLDHYRKKEGSDDVITDMDESRLVLGEVIEEYQAAAKSDFLEWCAKRDEKPKSRRRNKKDLGCGDIRLSYFVRNIQCSGNIRECSI
jgi:tubulin gamma